MYSFHESPGSVRNQIGRSLCAIRDAVSVQDVDAVANQLSLLVALTSPYLDAETEKLVTVEYTTADNEREVFRMCMVALSRLLKILAECGLYAFVAGEIGDASELALGDEGAEAEPGLRA